MSRDPAWDTLIPFLQDNNAATLWVADENALDMVAAVAPRPGLVIVCNRFDVVAAAQSAGHQAIFSDFDFSSYADGSMRRIVYRISKEKPVVHHILNNAFRLLAIDGELRVAGLKNDGTKTYIEKMRQRFGNGDVEKHGVVYRGYFCKVEDSLCVSELDTQDYVNLRMVRTPDLDFYSKPGVFGWNRIDQGSAFLLQYLPEYLVRAGTPPTSLLDLGCGYGYLTLMTRHLPLLRRVATDNNMAALDAMARNAEHYGIDVDVVASDAAQSLQGGFDLILCNPPFHQGFSVACDLTDKFLSSAQKQLSLHGAALFVVNAFIAIEKKAATYFSSVDVLANNRSFKVVLLHR